MTTDEAIKDSAAAPSACDESTATSHGGDSSSRGGSRANRSVDLQDFSQDDGTSDADAPGGSAASTTSVSDQTQDSSGDADSASSSRFEDHEPQQGGAADIESQIPNAPETESQTETESPNIASYYKDAPAPDTIAADDAIAPNQPNNNSNADQDAKKLAATENENDNVSLHADQVESGFVVPRRRPSRTSDTAENNQETQGTADTDNQASDTENDTSGVVGLSDTCATLGEESGFVPRRHQPQPPPRRMSVPGAFPVRPARPQERTSAYSTANRMQHSQSEASLNLDGADTSRGSGRRGSEVSELASTVISAHAVSASGLLHDLPVAATRVDDACIVNARPVDDEDVVVERRVVEEELRVVEEELTLIKRRHRTHVLLAVGLMLVVVVVASVATVFSSRNGGDSGNDRTEDNILNEADFDQERRTTLQAMVSPLSGDAAFDPDGPAFSEDRIAALDWLASDMYVELDVTPAWRIQQRYVMALLYHCTNGEEWFEKFSFLSERDECEWNRAYTDTNFLGDFEEIVGVEGTICDRQGRVQKLNLWWNNLSGTLPHELAHLHDSLTVINVVGGSISSTIPSSYGDLSNLKFLYLTEHCLSGTFPETVGTLPSLNQASFNGNKDLGGSVNGFCNGSEYRDGISFIAASCGDCIGSEVHVECECCVCCDSATYDCCDKEGNVMWKYHHLEPNPLSSKPLSFDRPCLSEEALRWQEEECPCVDYAGARMPQCSAECP